MNNLKVTILSLAFSYLALAGNGAGGGTDNQKSVLAWFLGPEKVISSCIRLSPTFGVSETEVISTIQAVYKKWGDYLVAKNIPWEFGSTPIMSTKINVQEKCKGNEDLIFYFGVEDEQVKKAKAHYHNPYAFAEQLSYDHKNGTSKGFIWIAPPGSVVPNYQVPNWTLPNTLFGILLHEVGHTLGSSHINNTIMGEYFGEYIFVQGPKGYMNEVLTHIDHQNELAVCRKCGAEFTASENDTEVGTGKSYLFDAFHELTGKTAISKPVAKFTMNIGAGKLPNGEINFADESTSAQFHIQMSARVSDTRHQYQKAFTALVGNTGADVLHIGYVYYGTMEGNGKKWNVVMNRNMSGMVEIVQAETAKRLFWSKTRHE